MLQWENHAKSLKLEEQTLAKIKSRIEDKVMKNSGTWIDWQYLLKAAELLMKVHPTCLARAVFKPQLGKMSRLDVLA